MSNTLKNLIETTQETVKYWWLLLIAGIILILGAITVMIFPVEAYLTLSILLGIIMGHINFLGTKRII